MSHVSPQPSTLTHSSLVASSDICTPDLVVKISSRRYKYRNYALLGIAALLLSLLAVPGELIKSSAQQVKRQETKTGGLRSARVRVSNPAPNAPLVQPNDVCGGAIPIALRQSVDGSLSTAANDYTLTCGVGCFTGIGQVVSTAPGRDVVYSFTAPATDSYSFKVTQFPTPSNLVLYTSATCPAPGVVAALRASNRNTAGFSEEVDCQALTSGQQVFIFVDEDAIGTSTTFKIEATQCQRETEPNDTPGTANANIFGVEGSISSGSDVDYFSLGTTVPGSRIFALADGSAGIPQGTDDFDMRVTTTTDTLEYDDDNAFGLFGSFAPMIGGRAVTGPATFLQISPFGITANEPYRLYAIMEPPGANPISGCVAQTTSAIDETEPNDTPATANTSPGGLGYFEGTIDDTVDTDDFYAIDVKAGDIIFVSLDLDPCRDNSTFDGDLFFVAPDGATVLTSAEDPGDGSTSDNTSGAGTLFSTTPFSPAEALVYRIQTTGTYYVVAEAFSGTGDYLLAISRNGNLGTGPSAAPTTISGRVTTADGSPLAGATVNLSGVRSARAITDSNGNYHFAGLESGGFYALTPELANYHFSPASRSFSLVGTVTDAEFTAAPDTTVVANAIDTPEYFVRQQYLDFLGREPEAGGFNYWSDQVNSCNGDADCMRERRIDVSAAFFMSQEFADTGSFVYRLYRGALGRQLRYSEFSADRAQVLGGPGLETSKTAFADAFVARSEFADKYQGKTTADAFVDALLQTMNDSAGVNLSSERAALISRYNEGSTTSASRALVVRQLIDNATFANAVYNQSFVAMQYFGYLHRTPDTEGLNFWVNVLNSDSNNYRGMVCSFITSAEYQRRFSSVVSHSNAECGR